MSNCPVEPNPTISVKDVENLEDFELIRRSQTGDTEAFGALVHQVSDWGSGVAIKMGRRQGGPSRTGDRKEHIWIDT